MKRRNFPKLLVLAAMAAALVFSMTACSQHDDDGIDPAYVQKLEKECIDLRNQLQALTSQLSDLEQSVVLTSYTLKAVPNDDNSGAAVEMTAVPMRHEEGQSANFRVTLDGVEVASVDGKWDGTAYTATASLKAADGYAYECFLTKADGSQVSAVLSSPEAPLYESCVYLQSGLNAYCNMFVEDWSQDGRQLVLTTAYVQVQLPRIGGRSVEYKSSDLVLRMGDEELQRVALTIPKGETEGSFEQMLSDIRLNMPEIKDDQQLDLWLEVSLTDGQVLTYNGCSWYLSGGELVLAVG